jgi:hypothetical protein
MGSASLSRLRRAVLLGLLGVMAGCDEGEPVEDTFEHEPVYTVEYRIRAAGDGVGLLYASTLGPEGRFLSAGRVQPPWSHREELASGRTARMRAWGLGGSASVELEIVIQEKVQARQPLAPGQDLRELRFRLP